MTDACAIKIPVSSPSATIRGFRDAIDRLACDRAELEQLSRGALLRARDYLWDRQGDRMAAIYRAALARNRADRPGETECCCKNGDAAQPPNRSQGALTGEFIKYQTSRFD